MVAWVRTDRRSPLLHAPPSTTTALLRLRLRCLLLQLHHDGVLLGCDFHKGA
jgi:hypothetical protein